MKACVDASLLVELVTREPGSARVEQWFAAHVGYDFIAPHLWLARLRQRSGR